MGASYAYLYVEPKPRVGGFGYLEPPLRLPLAHKW